MVLENPTLERRADRGKRLVRIARVSRRLLDPPTLNDRIDFGDSVELKSGQDAVGLRTIETSNRRARSEWFFHNTLHRPNRPEDDRAKKQKQIDAAIGRCHLPRRHWNFRVRGHPLLQPIHKSQRVGRGVHLILIQSSYQRARRRVLGANHV